MQRLRISDDLHGNPELFLCSSGTPNESYNLLKFGVHSPYLEMILHHGRRVELFLRLIRGLNPIRYPFGIVRNLLTTYSSPVLHFPNIIADRSI